MPGGVGAYTQELAKALCHAGIPSTVITSQAAADPATSAAITNGSCRRILPVVQRWDWGIWRIVKNLATEVHADWIHIQYQTAAFGMHPAINFAPQRWRDDRQRVAWTYHDLLVPYLFPKAGGRLRTWVTERPARTADVVIVTNEGDRSKLSAHNLASISVPIGSNIVSRVLTEEERNERRRAYGYGKGDLVLAYFGFLNRSKGGITLIRACAAAGASAQRCAFAHDRRTGRRERRHQHRIFGRSKGAHSQSRIGAARCSGLGCKATRTSPPL